MNNIALEKKYSVTYRHLNYPHEIDEDLVLIEDSTNRSEPKRVKFQHVSVRKRYNLVPVSSSSS